MMHQAMQRVRAIATGIGLAVAASLGGCGGFDGVELNGKIFDALGMSGDLTGKKAEPKTQARAPLVMPPDSKRLPDPNAEALPVAAADTAWPKDRDAQRVSEADAKKRAQDQRCKEGNWKEKAHKDSTVEAQMAAECPSSLFSWVGESLFGNKKD